VSYPYRIRISYRIKPYQSIRRLGQLMADLKAAGKLAKGGGDTADKAGKKPRGILPRIARIITTTNIALTALLTPRNRRRRCPKDGSIPMGCRVGRHRVRYLCC
jgi:hypothetical protein